MDIRRLVVLFIFSFSLVMLWDAWQKYSNPPPTPAEVAASLPATGVPAPAAPQSTTVPAAASSSVPVPSAPTASAGVPVPVDAPAQGEVVEIKTDLFVAQVSTQGGDIVSMELEKYKATADKAQKFKLFEGKHRYAAQSGLIGGGLPNHKTVYSVVGGKADRVLGEGDKTIELKLEAPAVDGVKVSKIYTFTRGSYLVNVAHEIQNGSQKEVAAHVYYQLQRDTETPEGESRMVNTFTGPALYTEQDKFQKLAFSDIEKGKAKFVEKADNGWMAMIQHYFVAAWLPPQQQPREYYVNKLDIGGKPAVAAGVLLPTPVVAPGGKTSFATPLYAGPQLQSTLDQLAKPVAEGGIGAEGLPLVVDYGRLTIVAAPIFWLLDMIHKIVGNWGWAIVILTILIKLAFFPLSAASYRSMAQMRKIGPRMQALKERYGDDRQKLNAEMMNIYKTEKINPLGGCLPIVVQIPVFIALYWALLGAVEMRDAPWILWIHDLSSQDPYYVLPVIMVVSMLIQTRLSPTPPDPIQAKMMLIMPFVFGFMFFFFPAGLVLYWVVNNVLSIAQQWQITRMVESGGKAANDAKA